MTGNFKTPVLNTDLLYLMPLNIMAFTRHSQLAGRQYSCINIRDSMEMSHGA